MIRPPRPSPLAPPGLSIIVPALNEEAGIAAFLGALQPLRARGTEVIVADGGSRDGTIAAAAPLVDRVTSSPQGRALQMNAGAATARGEVLLFLHADSTLPESADRLILDGLAASRRQWGRFDVRLSGTAPLLRVVERMMNWRSRMTGISTGDQGLFVERALFERMNGFPPIMLMEDVAMTKTLKRCGPPLCLAPTMTTSSRRWERDGIWRTMVLMWWLRLAYLFGAEPARLAEIYHGRKE